MALPFSLLQSAGIRRATEFAQVGSASVPSAYSSLDAELPGGGWPSGALTEILLAHEGIGELRLLGPALASLSQRRRRLAWIAPPYLPYAPALSAAGIDPAMLLIIRCATATESLWAAEQCLKSAACGAVLLWPQQPRYTELRRLQLAAADTTSLVFVFRSASAAAEASPAALRVALNAASGGLSLRILKRRGMALTHPLLISPASPHAVDRPSFPAIRIAHPVTL